MLKKETFDYLLAKTSSQIKLSERQPSKRKPKDKVKDKGDDDKKNKPPKSKDIVDMGSVGGFLADTVTPESFGGDRAGRAQSMAVAIKKPSAFSVKHPLTQTLAYALASSLAGGFAGRSLVSKQPDELPLDFSSRQLGGTVIGGTAGIAIGGLLAGLMRRKQMNDIAQEYDLARSAGLIAPEVPKLSPASALLLPLRGPHRRGQLTGYKLMNNTLGVSALSGPSGIKYTLQLPPASNIPAGLVGGYSQNFLTQDESSRLLDDKTSNYKQANILAGAKIIAGTGKRLAGSGLARMRGLINNYLLGQKHFRNLKSEISFVPDYSTSGRMLDVVPYNTARNIALKTMATGGGLGAAGASAGFMTDDAIDYVQNKAKQIGKWYASPSASKQRSQQSVLDSSNEVVKQQMIQDAIRRLSQQQPYDAGLLAKLLSQ